jgi:catechol 2,3-dioxygenase
VSETETQVKGGVKELGHVVLYVRDIDRSVTFYEQVLGWRRVLPLAGEPLRGIAMFSGGRTHHELLLIEVGQDAAPIPPAPRVGLYHFGLKVGDTDDELRAALARLTNAGARVVGAGDHGFTHSLYIEDPDGNELELYVDVPGIRWDDPEVLTARVKPLDL